MNAEAAQEVQEHAGGGAPNDGSLVFPAANRNAPVFVEIGAAAPAFGDTESRQGENEEAVDFVVVDTEVIGVGDYGDERVDPVAGDGGHRGKHTHNFHLLRSKADLFFGLPKGGGQEIRVVGVPHSPGKRNLALVVFEVHGALGEKEMYFPLGFV